MNIQPRPSQRPKPPNLCTMRSDAPRKQFSIGSLVMFLLATAGLCLQVGCGTTTQRRGTEQLLLSDAVDHAIAQVDFRPLSGKTVYLDSSYLQSVKGVGFVNAPYIISSLRQQMTAAGCLLQDTREKSEVICEARVGALGTDGHEVIYGIPKNNLLSSASSVIPGAPAIPVIPELSAARVDAQQGIAKIMVFAYDSETRRPVWQSGVARSESNSRNSWVLGAGPFQRGTVHDGTRFAGERIKPAENRARSQSNADYFVEKKFPSGYEHSAELPTPTPEKDSKIRHAGHDEPIENENP